MLEIIDYLVLVITLCTSAFTGLYFGCSGTKKITSKEYLYGRGKMKAIPIGLSIFSSAISAITIAGNPAEMYVFGTQFFMVYVGPFLSLILVWNFVLPVFCGELKINTPYEYYELRFNYKIRLMSTIMYIFHTILYMPVVLYASTINLSEITQISLPICTTLIGGVCIFYTVLGGFSAVIWSDTLQAFLMLSSCIFIMIKGIINIGGISEVYNRAEQGGRINFFTMDPNPFLRLTLWSATLGMCFTNGAHSGCGASGIQRFMALKNKKQAKISTIVNAVATSITGGVVCMIGLNMFAQYYNCDPVKNKDVNSYNRLLSYYLISTVKDVPGFLGLFNAGIMCAGLSTLSAELNTVSGLIYHCIIKKIYKKPINEFNGAMIMRIVVLIIGVYYLAAASFMDKSKHLLAFAYSVAGISNGAKLGMIILGTTFPKCNSIGVAVGAMIGIIVIGWITLGATVYDVNSQYMLRFSTENCSHTNFTEIFNTSSTKRIPIEKNGEPFFAYKLSFMYYVLAGTIITIIVGLIISYCTGNNDQTKIDPNLLIPSVRKKNSNSTEETVSMLHFKK